MSKKINSSFLMNIQHVKILLNLIKKLIKIKNLMKIYRKNIHNNLIYEKNYLQISNVQNNFKIKFLSSNFNKKYKLPKYIKKLK